MPKVFIYNAEGQAVGELDLSNEVFGVKPDAGLVHEALVAQQANARRSIAHTKTRADVRGGGRKPWKQKGTGRARQGSTRSPQWVGGGIAFGPRSERNFSVKINKRAKRQALFMALSDKLADQHLMVLESMTIEPLKTKVAATVFKRLPVGKSVLVVSPMSQPMLLRMVRNLRNIKLVTVGSVNLADVLAHRSIVFLKDAVPAFEKIYRQ